MGMMEVGWEDNTYVCDGGWDVGVIFGKYKGSVCLIFCVIYGCVLRVM